MILSKRIKTISSSTTGTDFYFPASLWPGHPHSARVSHSSHRHSRPQCHTTALLEVIACVFLCPAAQGSLGNVLDVKSSPNLHVHRNRWDTCAHANSTLQWFSGVTRGCQCCWLRRLHLSIVVPEDHIIILINEGLSLEPPARK